jgi:hypothetical protein
MENVGVDHLLLTADWCALAETRRQRFIFLGKSFKEGNEIVAMARGPTMPNEIGFRRSMILNFTFHLPSFSPAGVDGCSDPRHKPRQQMKMTSFWPGTDD